MSNTFRGILFIMLYKVVLTLIDSVDGIPKSARSNISITFLRSEQCYLVVLFLMLQNKVALTFETVDENLKCDHSNESY